MYPARFQKPAAGSAVQCLLCPHECLIPEGSTGRCRVRRNLQGILHAESYGVVSSLALDPIEKKPLYHFHPGSFILSAGSRGCNLSCRFCQNHEISQTGCLHTAAGSGDRIMTPAELVDAAVAVLPRGNIGIAFTYNEPFVGYEFVYDASILARERGLKTVLVTNGFVNPEPLAEILPRIDAMNIDLKAFTDGFYRRICGGRLEPVLETIRSGAASCHVEVTTLVIPGLNSAPAEIDALASALAQISADIPLHLNRHHPAYRMAEPSPISVAELHALAGIARRHLSTVHCGNVPSVE